MKKLIICVCIAFLFIPTLHAESYSEIRTLIQNGQSDEALAQIEALDADSKKSAEVDFLLASVYQQKNDLNNSIKYAANAVNKAPNVSEHQMIYAESQGLLLQQSGGVMGKLGQAKRLRKAFQKAVALDPDNLRARNGLSQFYLQAPGIVGGSKKKALAEAQTIYAKNKKMAYPLLVQIYQETKKPAKAHAVLNEWSQTTPDAWEPVMGLVFIEQSQNNFDKSYEVLSAWLEKNPQHLPANYQIGRLAAISGDYLDAGESGLLFYLSQPLEKYGIEHQHAHRRLAMLYQHKKEIEKAKAEVAKGLALEPTDKDLLKLKSTL